MIHLVGDGGTSSDLAVSLLDLVSLLECSSVGAQLLVGKNEKIVISNGQYWYQVSIKLHNMFNTIDKLRTHD